MKIVTAWSGEGDFKSSHVQSLARQCARFAPGVDFICITPERIPGVDCRPGTHKWPGWWHKYEIFAPHIRGKILYMDIDTVIRDGLSDILVVDKLTLLRDFYRTGRKYKEGLQASLMLLPDAERSEIWEDWMRHPDMHMQRLGYKGDQPMLEDHFLQRAQRWQDVVPGQIVSWKVDCGGGNLFRPAEIPEAARLVVFHGQPRPWACKEFEDLYT